MKDLELGTYSRLIVLFGGCCIYGGANEILFAVADSVSGHQHCLATAFEARARKHENKARAERVSAIQ